jgi:hypothetical protein
MPHPTHAHQGLKLPAPDCPCQLQKVPNGDIRLSASAEVSNRFHRRKAPGGKSAFSTRNNTYGNPKNTGTKMGIDQPDGFPHYW